MPILTGRIGPWDPSLDVMVMLSPQRVAALKKRGLPFAPPSTVQGLIDTGASCSAIDVHLANGLGLEIRGVTNIHTPSTGDAYVTRSQYDACFVIGEGQPKPLHLVLSVIESDLANQGFSVLIGRDVLEHCTFTYEGPTARYTLEF